MAIRRGLGRAVKRVAAATSPGSGPASGIVILAYHRVGERSRAIEIDMPTAAFADQVAQIAERATTLNDALPALEHDVERSDAPRGDIVVTFDDGTADFVDVAMPILADHAVPAVLYLATQYIDEGISFPDDGRPASWSALRDVAATGLVAFGSHTHSHLLLDRSTPGVVAEELDRSIKLIADQLGSEPEHFAYPKALPGSTSVSAEVACRFRSAALAGTKSNPYGRTNPHRLARSPIQRSDAMRWFECKLRGGMATEDRLRRLANHVRYAGKTA